MGFVLWGTIGAGAALAQGLDFGSDPPWAVESPGGVGSTFGLGIEYLSERQGSLEIRSTQSVVTLSDLEHGTVSTTITNGDPALLQRKFNVEWQAQGPGVSVPLRLPSLRLPSGGGIYPSLVLDAATADVSLDFHNKPERANNALQGRGPMYGLGLDVIGTVCNRCPWYAVGYQWRNFPSLAVDRSPGFLAPGFDVLENKVWLSRKSQSFSTRIGYTSPGNRIATYIGIRRLRTDIEVLDKVGLGSQTFRQETMLSSSTKLASRGTEKVVGIDVHLGGPFFARSELAFGDRQREGLLDFVYLLSNSEKEKKKKSPEIKERERRAKVIAATLAAKLERIYIEFSDAREHLPAVHLESGSEAYPRRSVLDLLGHTEQELLEALNPPELVAMQDYFRDLFEQARASLGLEERKAASQEHPPSFSVAPVRLVAGISRFAPARAQDRDALAKKPVDSWTGIILDAIRQVWIEATRNDLLVTVCIKSSPQMARFTMRPLSYIPPNPPDANTNFQVVDVWRGLYEYEVRLQGYKPFRGRLGWVTDSRPIVECPLIPEFDQREALLCKQHNGDAAKECPDHEE